MNEKQIKLSNEELKKCIDELEGTNFLNAFCVLDWILKTRKENKELHNKIDKAIEYMNNNGEKQYNTHDNYRGKWYSPDELYTILKILKDSDVDE